jgi:hypothetical protein
MNNRLNDIPAWAMEDSDDDIPKEDDVEQGKGKPKFMDHFFREVTNIKADIDAVAQAAKEIDNINEFAMRATTSDEENKLSKQLKPLVEAINQRARRTKTLLGLLKEETTKLEAENKLSASDIR